jgi:hypothetical protein
MEKVTIRLSISILIFTLLSFSVFPSGRAEEPTGKQETRMFWVLDGSMSTESAEMFLERYLFPTSLAVILWTEYTLVGKEVRFDTRGGYRIVRKQRVLAESIGAYTVYGYDLIIDVTWPAEAWPAEARAPKGRTQKTYVVQFSYPESAASSSGSPPKAVLPQPLEQALLAGIREDGRTHGRARVEQVEYLGAGRFRAAVLVGD